MNMTRIKMKVRSRHINAKTYNCYIEYESNVNSYAGIKQYACDCPNGNRMVGCSSQVAAIIYYLSHVRYKSRIVNLWSTLSTTTCNQTTRTRTDNENTNISLHARRIKLNIRNSGRNAREYAQINIHKFKIKSKIYSKIKREDTFNNETQIPNKQQNLLNNRFKHHLLFIIHRLAKCKEVLAKKKYSVQQNHTN